MRRKVSNWKSELKFTISLVKEYDSLVSKGIEPKIMMSAFNRIITPHDILAGRENTKVLTDGTCGKGLYPTFKRYQSRSRVQHTSMFLGYENGPETILDEALEFHKPEASYYEGNFLEACDRLKSIIKVKDSRWTKDYDVLIFEGSQGLLLDMDCGFYPTFSCFASATTRPWRISTVAPSARNPFR